jgi:hypothetical protein
VDLCVLYFLFLIFTSLAQVDVLTSILSPPSVLQMLNVCFHNWRPIKTLDAFPCSMTMFCLTKLNWLKGNCACNFDLKLFLLCISRKARQFYSVWKVFKINKEHEKFIKFDFKIESAYIKQLIKGKVSLGCQRPIFASFILKQRTQKF